MKLRQWLGEYKQMSYTDYQTLEEDDRREIEIEFQYFNAKQNRTKQTREKMIREGTIIKKLSEDELTSLRKTLEEERVRYETNLKIGGIDQRGNYTALHHRWDED